MADKKQKLKKLLTFKEDASFATFNEILQNGEEISVVKDKQDSTNLKIDESTKTILGKQDETMAILDEINSKEFPEPKEFPTEISISNQISTAVIEKKIDGVISAIQDKENKEVNLEPLTSLLKDIKNKKVPEFSTKELADSIDSLAKEIKEDRLVDKTIPENPELSKKFEELIKKIEALIKAGGLGGKKSIIGGWGSDQVTVLSSALPTGASTSAKQDSTISAIETIGIASAGNSTTTPLGIGGVFTGTAVDTTNFVTLNVVVYSNVASATDGFCIDWSSNGTNWDLTECHTISAGIGVAHLSRCKAKYARIRYTNGSTGQTTFRLATLLKRNAVSMTYEQLSSDVDDSHDAALVRAVLSAKKPNNDYTNIHATAGGNLKISLEEIDPSVALPTTTATYTTRLDETGATYNYVGKAAAGSSEASAVWQITRYPKDYTTGIFADGDTLFNNIWANRASLSYS